MELSGVTGSSLHSARHYKSWLYSNTPAECKPVRSAPLLLPSRLYCRFWNYTRSAICHRQTGHGLCIKCWTCVLTLPASPPV